MHSMVARSLRTIESSVSSNSRRVGDRLHVSQAWATWAAKPGSLAVLAERLMPMLRSMPWACHIICWRSTVLMTNWVSWPIMPRSSQMEAIMAGLTCSGWLRGQRISASAA